MTKTVLSLLAVTLLTSYAIVTEAFAVKHTVNVQNYVFIPANLNVQVGDTIRWVWINGVHTTTSTTIPTGASSWDAPMTSSNPVYEYRVAVAGVYNYLCTPHSSSQIGSFTATMPAATLSVTPSNRDVTAGSGSTTFSVTSNSNWTVVSNAGWCTVTASGSGNGTIVANYLANTTTSQRVATITVSVAGLPNSVVTVTQAGATATLSVTPANRDVTSEAGTTNFSVTSNSNWTSSSNSEWCTVTPSGSGNGTINTNYQSNTSSSTRVATITVSVAGLPNSTVTVTQAGFIATLSVTPSNRNVTADAGNTTFTITSNSNWNAISNSDWVTVTASGSGNGVLNASYELNEGIESRVAVITVTVSGLPAEAVTVTQAGAETVLVVEPLNQNVSFQAGTTSFAILSNTSWAVTTSDLWVTSTADGSGNGAIVVEYEENTSPDFRIANLLISAGSENQLITITQEGAVSTNSNKLTGISVYPNPSKGIINISSDQIVKTTQLRLYDLKGNVLISNEITDLANYKLDASNLARGTYMLKLDQNTKTYVTRIVILD